MKIFSWFCLLPSVAFCALVEPLPGPEFADTEVSTNIPFEVSFDAMSRIEFSLSLDASPTNNVEVSIGTDADGDGNLSVWEAAHTFGFDCGRWFQRDADEEHGRTGVPPVQDWPAQNGQDARSPNERRFSRNFLLKKRQLDEAWNLVKVTRRGRGDIGEITFVNGYRPGCVLEVR